MVFAFLDELKANTNEKEFKDVLKMADEDIKFNRVRFGICTSQEDYIEICERCLTAYRR